MVDPHADDVDMNELDYKGAFTKGLSEISKLLVSWNIFSVYLDPGFLNLGCVKGSQRGEYDSDIQYC